MIMKLLWDLHFSYTHFVPSLLKYILIVFCLLKIILLLLAVSSLFYLLFDSYSLKRGTGIVVVMESGKVTECIPDSIKIMIQTDLDSIVLVYSCCSA